MAKNGKKDDKILVMSNRLSYIVFIQKIESFVTKLLCSTGPKLRKNSVRVDFNTFQDEIIPKFLAKI